MLRAVLLLCVVMTLSVCLCSAQQYEFCYIIQGGASSTTGGYASWGHGYLYTSATSGSQTTILNTAVTRTVINAVGQRHVEQLSGIVPTNNRVDTTLFLTPATGSGYVDGSGIQLPINGTLDPVNGVGTLLGYDLPVVATIVSAYGQTSQLNANVNLLYTNGQYGERLDAGGATTTGNPTSFQLVPYNPSTPITNCSVTLYQPLCINSPANPPTGSVLFNITLNVPWTSLPATYLGDLFTSMTVLLNPSNTQAQYLGYFLFSCYPLFSATTGSQPNVWFYLNAQSAQAMGLSLASAVSTIQAALQTGSTTLNNAYLPVAEQGLIQSAGCPQTYSGGQTTAYTGVAGCAGPASSSVSSSTSTPVSPPPSSAVSSSTAGTPAGGATTTTNSGGGSSGLSHGAIAGIVVGSVVGALLLLLVCFLIMRAMSGGGMRKSTSAEPSSVQAGGVGHKQFENEVSQVSTADPNDGVEMA